MHQRRYNRAELRDKVERARFRVERITSFVSFLLPLMMLSRRKRKDHDLWAEFQINRSLNVLFEKILVTERALIRSGLSFPAGGSLLLVARKPVSAS